MRQVGTLPDGRNARALADYLKTLSIETRLQEAAEGWEVWVCDEDQVPRAREEFQTYVKDPGDTRYRAAAAEAGRRRSEEARLEKDYQRKQEQAARRLAAGPSRRVTITLVLASFAVSLLFNDSTRADWVRRYLFITEFRVEGDKIVWFRGLEEIQHGQVWRLVTPILIHFGPWHLLFNSLALLYFGGQVEARYGSLRLALLVLGIAALSNWCQYNFSTVVLDGLTPRVVESHPNFGGLSGVVFGLFGYVWMKAVYQPGCGLFVTPFSVLLMIGWLLLCMTGWVGQIANTAHFVGLAAGMILGYASAWRAGFGAS